MISSVKIPTIIVEDEPSSLKLLILTLKEIAPEIDIIETSSTVSDAHKKINLLRPALVFLDIDLGNQTSFDLLNMFPSVFFKIIFVTGHNEYAIKAFKYSAVDYILKPVTNNELKMAVNKIKENLLGEARYKFLMEQFHQVKPTRIALKTGTAVEFVGIQEIVHCKADGDFSHVFLKNGIKHYVSQSLKELENLLSEHLFLRVHKSHLINLNEIKSYGAHDSLMVIMNDNIPVPVAQRNKQNFFDHIKVLKLS